MQSFAVFTHRKAPEVLARCIQVNITRQGDTLVCLQIFIKIDSQLEYCTLVKFCQKIECLLRKVLNKQDRAPVW